MTKDDLDRLEELEKAATPGKWEADWDGDQWAVGPTTDATFIAEFRNAAKDLIALARKGLENE